MSEQPQSPEDGARDEGTVEALVRAYRNTLAQIEAGRFDAAELGERYEGLAKNIPVAAQWVDARRSFFAWLRTQNPKAARAVEVTYHAGEGGARVTAALSWRAAELAASNYGAPSAAELAAARALAAAAGPVGLGLAVLGTVLTFTLGGGAMTADEARRAAVQLYLRRRQARAILSRLGDAQRAVLARAGLLGYLQDVATVPDDPAAWLGNPRLVRAYRALLVRAGERGAALSTEAGLRARASAAVGPIREAWLQGAAAARELEAAGLLPVEAPEGGALDPAALEGLKRLGARAALRAGKFQIRPRTSGPWWRTLFREIARLVAPRAPR